MRRVAAKALAVAVVLFGLAVPGAGPASAGGCAPASVAVADLTQYEGTRAATDPNPSYTTFTFTVTVTATAGCAPTGSVSYKTEDGVPGATAPSDYVAAAGQLTWNQDATARTIQVQVLRDAVPEPNEGFLVQLYDPVGLTVSDGLAAGGVLDDDGMAGPGQVASTDGGKICWRTCAVGVHLSTPAKAPVTVHYRTIAIGTGTLGYVPVKDATLVIGVGVTQGDAVVQLTGEPVDSQFFLEIFSPSAGTIGTARAEVTIKPGG